MDRHLVLGRAGDDLLEFLSNRQYVCRWQDYGLEKITYQLVEDTLVEGPLLSSAVPELLVVVLQTLPVLAELLVAVCVDVV
jgi:hypothetical protein